MLYRLIIVDDEEDIRDGLADLIDWSALGYTVAARLEDGRDALSFIRSHPVDVVLADIRMTHVSGLELAKYVADRQSEIQMVLISGYKEFEFAQQALQYKVAHYLLKPTRIDDIHQVFRELKQTLDKRRAEKDRSRDARRQFENMRSALQGQLFADLADGKLNDPDAIRSRLALVRLSVEPERTPCCLYALRIRAAAGSPDRCPPSPEGDAWLPALLARADAETEKGELAHAVWRLAEDRAWLAAMPLAGRPASPDVLKRTVLKLAEVAGSLAEAESGVEVKLEELRLYPSLLAIAREAPFADAGFEPDAGRRTLPPDGHSHHRPLERELEQEDDPSEPLAVRQAKSYIQERYGDELSLNDVAKQVYLNPVYFSRLFKKHTGRNLTDYIAEIRIRKAMEYLRQPQYRVYEVGSLVGYPNAKYFFKLFKQYVGCTPTVYRNTLSRKERP